MSQLIKTLNNTVFEDTINPYKTFVNKEKGLLAVANTYHAQVSGRDIRMRDNFLLLYDLATLELIGSVDDLYFGINDIAFHPDKSLIAIGIGSYDGGYQYEGKLLLWNYATDQSNVIMADNREVTECTFKGDKLSFKVNPADEGVKHFVDSTYKIDLDINKKIHLKDLKPISTTEHIEEPYDPKACIDAVKILQKIAKKKNRTYHNKAMVWDLVFINKDLLAIARNNATIEMWDLANDTVKEIILYKIDHKKGLLTCTEIFHNTTNNTLLVNLAISYNKNNLYVIQLPNYEVKKLMSCRHTLSSNKNNFFLARQTNGKKDFLLDPNYNIVFKKDLGHYDIFNHSIRIDNSDLLYFLLGKPNDQHQNKRLYSVDPLTHEIKEVWEIEKQPKHYCNISGYMVGTNLIINGREYRPIELETETTLFCIDLSTQKEKWKRKIQGQVTSFAVQKDLIVIAKTNGKAKLLDIKTGKTIESIKRGENHAYNKPLSLATYDNTIAIGLTNGQIEIQSRH